MLPSGLLHVSVQGKVEQRKKSLSPIPVGRGPTSSRNKAQQFTRTAENIREGDDGTFDSTDNDTHMRDTSKFSKDEEVLYRCNKFGVDLRATIVDVHSSDGPPCYYTIKLGQGSERELQTVEDRLSAFEEGYEEKMCKALRDVLANDTCLREMAAAGAAEKISSDRTVIGNVTTEAASGLSSNTDLQNDLVGEVAGKVGDLFVNDPNFMDGVGRESAKLVASVPGVRTDTANKAATMLVDSFSTSEPFLQALVSGLLQSGEFNKRAATTVANNIIHDESFILKTNNHIADILKDLKKKVYDLEQASGSGANQCEIQSIIQPLEDKLNAMMREGKQVNDFVTEFNELKGRMMDGNERYASERDDLEKRISELFVLSGCVGKDLTHLEANIKVEIKRVEGMVKSEIATITQRIEPLETKGEDSKLAILSWVNY